MNNTAARFFFGLIGILLIVNFIIGKWIRKEMQPEKPATMISQPKPQPVAAAGSQYDSNSDYPSYPSGTRENVIPAAEKKPERIPDEKIIYEMPTTNRFLLQ